MSQFMSVDLAADLATEQDAVQLANAVKKEAKIQRVIKALISQSLSRPDNDPQVLDTECNSCHVKLEAEQTRKCARCRVMIYCSRECQTSDWLEHKKLCEKQNFILKIAGTKEVLEDGDDLTAPAVHRTLSVPYQSTLVELGRAIQLAFGYTGESSWDFNVTNPAYEKYDPYEDMMNANASCTMVNGEYIIMPEPSKKPTFSLLRMTEQDIRETRKKPLHWDSPLTLTSRYCDRTPELPARQVKVSKLFEAGQKQQDLLPGCPIQASGSKLFYGYQFRDKWGNFIELIGRAPSTKTIACIDAQGAHLVEAMSSPKEFQLLRYGLLIAEKKRNIGMRRAVQKWQALGLTDEDIVDDTITITAIVNERIKRAGL